MLFEIHFLSSCVVTSCLTLCDAKINRIQKGLARSRLKNKSLGQKQSFQRAEYEQFAKFLLCECGQVLF